MLPLSPVVPIQPFVMFQPAIGDLLPYAAMEPVLADIFADFGTAQGVVLRHQRLLWLAHLPA